MIKKIIDYNDNIFHFEAEVESAKRIAELLAAYESVEFVRIKHGYWIDKKNGNQVDGMKLIHFVRYTVAFVQFVAIG